MDFSALDLTYDVCIISLLMLIAKLVRIRMRPLQNLFIPTALIAGFFGVLLGSHGLGVITLSSQASSYAGILITVLFATMYLTSGAVLILAGLALLGLCALRYGVRDKAGKVVFPASKRGE